MVESVELKDFTSKEGNPYKALVITFINGYVKRVYLNSSEVYMLESLK